MKKTIAAVSGVIASIILSSCLTVNEKKIVEAPYIPEASGGFEGEKEAISNIYYSETEVPEIDGNFNEWKNLEGVHTHQQVYGLINPSDADGFFVARTDGDNLYIYAEVTDDDPGINDRAIPQGWQKDGVEFFFGTDTKKHTQFTPTDVRVRLAPRSKEDMTDVGVGINDAEVNDDGIKCAAVYSSDGYKVEAKFPLTSLNNSPLKPNQKVRIEFQVNDADDGADRSGLLHWNSPNDNTYADPSSWGNGKVVVME